MRRENSRIGEEMQRTAAHNFSLGRVPARMFPEPSSDQNSEWEGPSPPPASERQSSFCCAFFLQVPLERVTVAADGLGVFTLPY